MADASLYPKELRQEVKRVLRDAEERKTDPVELYRSLCVLEEKCKTFGCPVPEALKHLERYLEQEFYATSQGR